jgi:hypothetical protein
MVPVRIRIFNLGPAVGIELRITNNTLPQPNITLNPIAKLLLPVRYVKLSCEVLFKEKEKKNIIGCLLTAGLAGRKN